MELIAVALHAESVDRNLLRAIFMTTFKKSLSMRRAWIEIFYRAKHRNARMVALHAESVDRNTSAELDTLEIMRRSPCGERG